jgi:hypothetical protein
MSEIKKNTPVEYVTGIQPACLPDAAQAEFLAQTMGKTMDDLGQSRNFLSFKGREFWIKTGGKATRLTKPMQDQHGQVTDMPVSSLDIVIIQMAPDRHCLYYENAYDEDSEAPPVAKWWQKAGPPEGVPNEKIMVQNRLVWPYQIKQRCVVALFDAATQFIDFDNLLGMDVSSASIFGESKDQHAYTFKSLMRWCTVNKFFPCVVPIRLRFTSDSVPVVTFTPLTNKATGQVFMFPERQLRSIYSVACSPDVKWYLDPVTNADDDAAPEAPPAKTAPVAPAAPAKTAPRKAPAQAKPAAPPQEEVDLGDPEPEPTPPAKTKPAAPARTVTVAGRKAKKPAPTSGLSPIDEAEAALAAADDLLGDEEGDLVDELMEELVDELR